MPNLSPEDRKRYEFLSLSIFKDVSPEPPEDLLVLKCPAQGCDAEINEFSINCSSCGSNFQSCVATGKPILSKDYYKCSICKHKTLMEAIRIHGIKHCVLCHNRIDQKKVAEKTNQPASKQPNI